MIGQIAKNGSSGSRAFGRISEIYTSDHNDPDPWIVIRNEDGWEICSGCCSTLISNGWVFE